MAKEFISIKKVIDGKDAIQASEGVSLKPESLSKVESDVVLLDDIISFRHWHKNGKDNKIPGEFTQLTLLSHGKEGGTWTCRILESEASFTNRIKEFRPVIAFA